MDFDAVWERSVSELNHSIREDNYEQFLSLLEQNVSINSPDNRGYQPIHLCTSTSNPYRYLVELLKFDVVNVNGQTYDGSSALLLLCKSITSAQLIDSVKLLVENGADINLANDHLEFPLLEAIKNGKFPIVEYLCSRPEIEIHRQDNQGISVVHEAVRKLDLKYLELLLKLKPRIDLRNIDSATPLFYAVFYRNCPAVQRLIECAKCDAVYTSRTPSEYVNLAATDGTTPLMIACQTGCLDCIRHLLRAGANVNARTSDQVTVLHFVAEFCGIEALELIVDDFALSGLPSFTDLSDPTILVMKNPLHLAISASNVELVKHFVDRRMFSANSFQVIEGISIANLKADSGLFYSALAFALSSGSSTGSSRSLIEYLVQSGGSLEMHSASIVPPVFCIFSSFNSITRYGKLFKQILKLGFDVNRFAKMRTDKYFSNFFLVAFFPEILKRFLNYGLDVDDLFGIDFDSCFQNHNVDATEFISLSLEKKGLSNLYESFSLISRTPNVRAFWHFLKANILNDLISYNREIDRIDTLFETPNSLQELCVFAFKNSIWRRLQTKNSAEFHEQVKNLNISPLIKSVLLAD